MAVTDQQRLKIAELHRSGRKYREIAEHPEVALPLGTVSAVINKMIHAKTLEARGPCFGVPWSRRKPV